MSENQRIIEKIIFSFKEEMSRIEHGNIFTLLARENPPTPQEMFTRQKETDRKSAEYENALRRILWRALGTVEEQREMLMTAAEKAVDEALEKLTEKLKGHGNITVDLEF